MAGLTGSGKTTIAAVLANQGFEWLSVDEEVFRLHGRYGIDYPEDTYFERERPVVDAVRRRFVTLLREGKNVVLDHGLWTRDDRQRWRDLACAAGATPVLVYLRAERGELMTRLAALTAHVSCRHSAGVRSR